MFRPFNLTSIAAWTIGSLAGNHAYYAAKRHSKGLKVSAVDCPANVRAFVKRLETIERECLRLGKALTEMGLGDGKANVTPFVHLCAYNDWLQSSKESIKAEARQAYESSMTAGYIWPATIISDVHNSVESMAVGFKSVTEDMRRSFEQCLDGARKQSMVPVVRKALQDRQKLCKVDESFKLVDLSKDKLILQ